jgi:hypothetical protein
MIKALVLALILAASTVAQVPQCTASGQAFWTVTPLLSEIHGCVGGVKPGLEVETRYSGYTGTYWLSAYTIELHYTRLELNGREVLVGPPDSGGKGFRALVVPN